MTTKNIQDVVAEFEQKFCRRAPQDNTTIQEIERWYAARDWLTTYSAKLVEAAREEELNRQTQNMDAVIAGMLQAARKEERERIVDICWRHFGTDASNALAEAIQAELDQDKK